MSLDILTGGEPERAVLFCNTTEVPLALEMFYGTDDRTAREMAERFIADATEAFHGDDLRNVIPEHLRKYQEGWFNEHALG